jgi:hypothetical protein
MKYTALILWSFLMISCNQDKKSETATEEPSTSHTAVSENDSPYPTQVYFGDTHLHTALSMDAGAFGNRLGMDEAYQFARGDEITSTTGIKTKLAKSPDFLVVAEKYNDPGKFTAFIGYEWTSLIKGNNLHRVVIYRDNGDKAINQLPFTNEDSSDPERLWDNLESYEKNTGGRVLAILINQTSLIYHV